MIALPIAFQQMISFGVQMLGNVMVGSLGSTALAAIELANTPFFVLSVLNFGLTSGGSVLIAQYWGKNNIDAVRRVLGISVRFVAVASILFTLVCNLFPAHIMGLFSREADVIAVGASYLRTVSLSYLFFGLSNCYLHSLRAVENVKLSTCVYLMSLCVTGFFSYVFIFGKLGFPELGVVGAAVGTIIARFSELLVSFIYMTWIDKKIGFTFVFLFKREKKLLPDYIRHSMPVVFNELGWSLGILMQTVIIGNIGSVFVAADSIASVVQQLGLVMLMGVSNAAAVTVGKSVGRGDSRERTKNIAKTMLFISIIVGLSSGILVFALRYPVLSLYNIEPEIKKLAIGIMTVMAINMTAAAIEMVGIIGILRGAGDTKFASAVDILCTWVIAVPLGYLAGFVWKLPLLAVYMCMRCDIPVRVFLCIMRIFRGKYIKNVTREV